MLESGESFLWLGEAEDRRVVTRAVVILVLFSAPFGLLTLGLFDGGHRKWMLTVVSAIGFTYQFSVLVLVVTGMQKRKFALTNTRAILTWTGPFPYVRTVEVEPAAASTAASTIVLGDAVIWKNGKGVFAFNGLREADTRAILALFPHEGKKRWE